MKWSKKVSLRQANEIHVSPIPAKRTKKDHLDIAMSNHDAESHDANDLWRLGTMRSEKLCRA